MGITEVEKEVCTGTLDAKELEYIQKLVKFVFVLWCWLVYMNKPSSNL